MSETGMRLRGFLLEHGIDVPEAIAAIEAEAVAAFKADMAARHIVVDDLAYEAGVEDEQARCKADMADVWREAIAAERARIRAAVEGLPYVYRQHTCWDNHEGGVDANGNSTLHADGSPCNDRVTTDAINRAAVLAAIDGEEVSR